MSANENNDFSPHLSIPDSVASVSFPTVSSSGEDVVKSGTESEREKIKENRRERRKIKREEYRAIKEKLKLQNKLNKESDKVKIISREELEKRKACIANADDNNIRQIAIRKFRKKRNLLEYIVERQKQGNPLERIEPTTPITAKLTLKINKGKKREFPKRHYTRLKKNILKYRREKLIITTTTANATQQESQPNDVKEINEKLEELKITETAQQPLKPNIHSRRFRPYCDNLTSKELCQLTENLLKDLFRFQKRAYEKNEVKARAHRRYVVGFREVQQLLETNKLKLIIFAPDCEKCNFPGGIDEIIETMKSKCEEREIPYLFSVNRRKLGYILMKKVPVSCIGILSYDGSQEIFKQIMEILKIERENYCREISSN